MNTVLKNFTAIAVLFYLFLQMLSCVVLVGQQRKPMTHEGAVGNIIITVLLMIAVIFIWLN